MIVRNKRLLNGIATKFNLDICSIYNYYKGNAYVDNKGNCLPTTMLYKNRKFKLKYFDGCFHPFIVEVANS